MKLQSLMQWCALKIFLVFIIENASGVLFYIKKNIANASRERCSDNYVSFKLFLATTRERETRTFLSMLHHFSANCALVFA